MEKIKKEMMKECLEILSKAKCQLAHEDYIKIWGEQLGNHIWRQEGSDLLRIWHSGITIQQADDFIEYILNKKFK